MRKYQCKMTYTNGHERKKQKKGFLSALFLQYLFSHLQKLGLVRQSSREDDIMTDQVAECCSEDRRRLSLPLLQACCTYCLHMYSGARTRKTYVCQVASMQTLARTHTWHFLYRHRHNSVWSLAERAAPSPQTVTLYRYSTGTMTSSYSVCSPLPPPPLAASFSHTLKSLLKGRDLLPLSHSRAH